MTTPPPNPVDEILSLIYDELDMTLSEAGIDKLRAEVEPLVEENEQLRQRDCEANDALVRLERECASLSASQCTEFYGDDHGHPWCHKTDRLAQIASLLQQVEGDEDLSLEAHADAWHAIMEARQIAEGKS